MDFSDSFRFGNLSLLLQFQLNVRQLCSEAMPSVDLKKEFIDNSLRNLERMFFCVIVKSFGKALIFLVVLKSPRSSWMRYEKSFYYM